MIQALHHRPPRPATSACVQDRFCRRRRHWQGQSGRYFILWCGRVRPLRDSHLELSEQPAVRHCVSATSEPTASLLPTARHPAQYPETSIPPPCSWASSSFYPVFTGRDSGHPLLQGKDERPCSLFRTRATYHSLFFARSSAFRCNFLEKDSFASVAAWALWTARVMVNEDRYREQPTTCGTYFRAVRR